MHLNPLKTKIIGLLNFEAVTPVHVGAASFGARRTMIRLSDGSIVIPSSTWKGVFRSIAEKIAPSMKLEGLEKIAIEGYREDSRGISYKLNDEYLTEFREVLENRLSHGTLKLDPATVKNALVEIGYEEDEIRKDKKKDAKLRSMASEFLALHCPIGRLFGNNLLAGKVRFLDSIIKLTEIHEKPGVGIDRKSGKAKDNILYFIETIPRGTEINLKMTADNLKPGETDSELLAISLNWIKELGIQIGGSKSTGLGELQLKDAKFYLAELKEDDSGLRLANPFKYGKVLNFKELLEWLREK